MCQAVRSYASTSDLLKSFNSWNRFHRFNVESREAKYLGLKAANENHRLMILGKPGSGKSIFLRYLAIACCQGSFLADHIPIVIEFRDIDVSNFDLFNEIYQELGLADAKQTIQILNQGKALILLDGLDEIPYHLHKEIQTHIQQEFLRKYYKNHIIITCRTQATEYISDKFDYVEIDNFNINQIEQFIDRWFDSIVEEGNQSESLKKSLVEQLKLPINKKVAELAITPILLSLICLIFSELKKFPDQRFSLYKQGIELLLQKWDEGRGAIRDSKSEIYRNLSSHSKQKLLAYLAARKFELTQYILFEQSEIQAYISEYLKISDEQSQEVIESIEAQHGLLVKISQKAYSFSHLTFQEGLTAINYAESSEPQALETLARYIVTDSKWSEVFRLTAEIIEDINEFFYLMKEQVDNLLASSREIQSFLAHIYRKSSLNQGNYQCSAIRAFYFDRHLNFADINIYQRACTLDMACKIDFDFANKFEQDIEFSFHFSVEFFELLEQVSGISPSPGLFSAFLFDCIFTLDTNCEFQKAIRYLKEQLFNSAELNLIDRQQKYKEWYRVNAAIVVRYVNKLATEHRYIAQEFNLGNEHVEMLKTYYDANMRLLKYLDSGCAVSDAVRKEIETALLLPLNEIKEYQE